MRELDTVADLFEALGGNAAVKTLLVVTASWVSVARLRNYIPLRHHRKILDALPAAYQMPDKLFFR
jgi:hypothetical protein